MRLKLGYFRLKSKFEMSVYIDTNSTINWILTDDIGAGHYRASVNGTFGAWSTWVNFLISLFLTFQIQDLINLFAQIK